MNEGAKDYMAVVRCAGGTTWHLQGPGQAQGKFWNTKWFLHDMVKPVSDNTVN